MTISHYVRKKKVKTSPLKQGPVPTLPLSLLDLLVCHVAMSQLSGQGDAKPKHVKGIIGAAIENMTYKSNLTTKYIYNKLCNQFPNTVHKSKSMKNEDSLMNWTTYANLNQWFDWTKAFLIHYGYVNDCPQCFIDIFNGRPLP